MCLQVLRIRVIFEEIDRRHHKIVYPDLQLAYLSHRQISEIEAID